MATAAARLSAWIMLKLAMTSLASTYGPSVTTPALMTRPLGFRPSPPTSAELYFCIHAYQAVCKACISSGDGWARFSVESRKSNKYFGIVVLQAVSRSRAEDCPPPCARTTNELRPFGHRERSFSGNARRFRHRE